MDGLSGIEWEIQRVTPAIAAEMLSRVAASGHLDQPSLQAFERDMRENR